MIERLRDAVARLLRVPPEPEPPPGDPATLRVFRAAPSYFRLKLAGWAVAQLGTLVGLIVGLVLISRFGWFQEGWVGALVTVLEVLAWLAFLAQLPVGLAALRLDYEFRWYMLSDRALRIREGVLSVRERTMTFANIQQIAVRQGPLQRALGVADLEVRTAGGGGGSSDGESGDDLHRGYLRGVADAESIRDTIRERVRRYRDAGLGDDAAGHRPVESQPGRSRAIDLRGPAGTSPAGSTPTPTAAARTATAETAARAAAPAAGSAPPGSDEPGNALVAARELLAEVRALRPAITGAADDAARGGVSRP